jgi:hypothetical protein
MFPTHEQVELAAFNRWLRRGQRHGFHRDDWFAAESELSFGMNYETAAHYPLDAPGTFILSDRPVRYCRFCERTSVQVAFGPPRPVLAGGQICSLCTEAVCDECQAGFRDAQGAQIERFRKSVGEDATRMTREDSSRGRGGYTLAVFKSLVGCALAIMPENELGYFVDTVEWVSNPDPEFDGRLLHQDATCLVYLAPFLGQRSWASIARRVENDAPLPYMISFLALAGVVIQVQLPMCIRDQDLDGRLVRVPRRSFTNGEGETFEGARVLEFRLSGPGSAAVARELFEAVTA